MKTFLIVIAGILIGSVVLIAGAWWWLKRKISQMGAAFAELAGAAPPPFRITLDAASGEPPWSDAASITSSTVELEVLGYQRAGDYTVPEMGNLPLRGFAHPESDLYAAVYEHPAAGLVIDVVCLLEDGWNITVSTAPETGLDQPPRSPTIRLARSATATHVHERMSREAPNRPRIGATPHRFEERFVEAYRREIDWRISRLGPTAEEIRRVAELSGEGPPERMAIDVVRSMWSSAIDDFIFEQARNEYLAGTSMSAGEWEEKRENIVVVHDYSDAAARIEELSWEVVGEATPPSAQERAREVASERLAEVFQGKPIRRAFMAAQALLPEARRYQPIGSVAEPWAADLYLLPEDV